MKSSPIVVLIKKELRRFFGDLPLLFGSVIAPAILIVAMIMAMSMIMSLAQKETPAEKIKIGVINSPKTLLQQMNDLTGIEYEVQDCGEDEISELFREKDYSAVLSFAEDFVSKIESTDGATVPVVRFYINKNDSQAGYIVNYISANVLSPYKQSIISSRIDDEQTMLTFDVNFHEVIQPKSSMDSFAGRVVPLMLLFLVTHAAVSLGVDLITSEKEKNTLAGYLLMPIKRSDIAFSKCISLAIITVADSFFMMGIMMIVMPFAMELFASDAFETIVFQLGIKQIIMLAIILISTAVLISAIVCYISSICKSTKAASGISVALYILSIVCGFSVMFDSILSVGLLTDAIPYLGNAAVIREIISGEQRMHDVLISVGSNMAISVILVWLTSKAFSEEKHMVSF